MDEQVTVDQHGPDTVSPQNAFEDEGYNTKSSKDDSDDTVEFSDPEEVRRRTLQWLKDPKNAVVTPIQVPHPVTAAKIPKAKRTKHHGPPHASLHATVDSAPGTTGMLASKGTEIKGPGAEISMFNQPKITSFTEPKTTSNATPKAEVSEYSQPKITTSTEPKTTFKAAPNPLQASIFERADGEIRFKGRKMIKETLQKTQDARRPLKLTTSANPAEESCSESEREGDGGASQE